MEKHYISIPEKDDMLDFLHSRYGLDLNEYSEASIRRRITKMLNTLNLNGIDKLKNELLRQKDGRAFFINNFTVNVTEMFRDPFFYESLTEDVFPTLKEKDEVKIWCAGCSSGEEVLSLAILLHENELLSKCEILGTDINTEMLNIARNRTYQMRNVKTSFKAYEHAGGKGKLSDYFSVNGEYAIFSRHLYENILFIENNLQEEFENNYFDLVLCRNVMIYFKGSLQDQVIENLRVSLRDEGYLALGSKESIVFYQDRHKFREVNIENKIFQKIG